MSALADAQRQPGSDADARPAPGRRVRMGCVHDSVLPIDDDGCVRFFGGTLFSARRRWERALAVAPAWLAPPLWRLVARDSRWVPLGPCSEPQTGPASGAGFDHLRSGRRDPREVWWLSCTPLITEGLRFEHAAHAPGGPRAIRWLARCRTETPTKRLVLFAFAEGASQPTAVLKVRSGVGGPRSLKREWEALRALERQPDLRDSVPRATAFHVVGQVEILWQTWTRGRSAYADLHRGFAPGRHVRRHFHAAADWLSRFHAATRRPPGSFTLADLDALVDAVRRRTGVTTAGTGWYRDLRSLMPASGLPVAAGHGDFWPRNLLLDREPGRGDRTSVVDWEESTAAAPVFFDLFSFPLSYGLSYPWRRLRRVPAVPAFRWTFVEATRVAHEVRRYLARYCEALDIERELARCLFPLFLLTRWAADTPTVESSRDADRARHEPWQTLHALSADGTPFVFCA